MPKPSALLAAALLLAARAEGLPVLPSGICQGPDPGLFLPDRPHLRQGGAEAWSRAFQAVIARCRKGDVLLLTRDAQANALRYCDFDRPVTFMAQGEAVCTFAGGIREAR